ncbi:MAG: hypothetical protein ACJ790_19010 [Myxococcaceae bacterium]
MKILPLVAALALCSCVTARATQFSTPKERVTECQQLCTDLGLRMSAVVVIMNSSGCVCEPPGTNGNEGKASAAAVGGAVIAATAQAHQQQQQRSYAH